MPKHGERKASEIRMCVKLGDTGEEHEVACRAIRLESPKVALADGSPVLECSFKVVLRLSNVSPSAHKNFPVHVTLDTDSAIRLAADILDRIAPRTLRPG